MQRRGFLGTLAALAAGVLGFGKTQAAPDLRKVWRASEADSGRTWTRIRMFEARKGDRLIIEDWDWEVIAISDPWRRNGVWCVDAELDMAYGRGPDGRVHPSAPPPIRPIRPSD